MVQRQLSTQDHQSPGKGETTPAKFDKQAGVIGYDPVVVEAFNNLKENLKAVEINLDESEYVVGRQS